MDMLNALSVSSEQKIPIFEDPRTTKTVYRKKKYDSRRELFPKLSGYDAGKFGVIKKRFTVIHLAPNVRARDRF